MSQEQSKLFLREMHSLIRNGRRYFVRRNRNGVSYIQMLADLGLTSVDEAWDCILELSDENYSSGPDYDRDDPSLGKVVYVFKKEINEILTYIKLKDETEKRGCVCISFHEDEP